MEKRTNRRTNIGKDIEEDRKYGQGRHKTGRMTKIQKSMSTNSNTDRRSDS